MTSRLMCAVLLTALGATSCARETPSAVENALPTLSVTHWTERTELFMEHPPLIGGHAALFAVHLTTMGDFKPVAAGQAKIEFTPESGGQAKVLTGPPPSRPGAFRIEDLPPPPGRYRWALVLDGSAVSDRHDLGSVTVFADEKSARSDAKRGITRRSCRHCLPERAAVDERVRDGARSGSGRANVHPCSRDGSPSPGRGGDRRRSRGRPTYGRRVVVDRRSGSKRAGPGPPGTAAFGWTRPRHTRCRGRRSSCRGRGCARRAGAVRTPPRRSCGAGPSSRRRASCDCGGRSTAPRSRSAPDAEGRNAENRWGRRIRQCVCASSANRWAAGGSHGHTGRLL